MRSSFFYGVLLHDEGDMLRRSEGGEGRNGWEQKTTREYQKRYCTVLFSRSNHEREEAKLRWTIIYGFEFESKNKLFGVHEWGFIHYGKYFQHVATNLFNDVCMFVNASYSMY